MDHKAIFKRRLWLTVTGLLVVVGLWHIGALGPYPWHPTVQYPESSAASASAPADYAKYKTVLSQIQGTRSLQTAATLATNAGLIVSNQPGASGEQGILISDPVGGQVFVSLEEYEDTFTSSVSTSTTPSPTAQNAVIISQSVPAAMTAGMSYAASVTVKNTGTVTWTAAQNYRLGSQVPQDNTTWGLGRVTLLKTDSIGPGQTKTFSFMVTAPKTPGTYSFSWKMLQEGVAWFGATSSSTVTVKAASQADAFVPRVAYIVGIDAGSLFAPLRAYASTVTGNDTGSSASCSVVGSNGTAVVMVQSDGNIYGITGNYDFNVSCDPALSQSDCTKAVDNVNSGNNFIEDQGGFKYQDSGSGNLIQVNIVPPPDGNTLAGVSWVQSVIQADGSFQDVCTINLYEQPGNPNPDWQDSIVTAHEMGHCFGLDHISSSLYPNNFMTSAVNNVIPTLTSWQSTYLKDLAAGNPIAVENCQPTTCGPGEVLSGSEAEGGTANKCVSESALCDPSTHTIWDSLTSSCQSCPDGTLPDPSDDTCKQNTCTPDEDGATMNCSVGDTSCSCDASGVSCSDAEGNTVVPPAGVCQGKCSANQIQQADGSCVAAPLSDCPDGLLPAANGTCEKADCVSTGEGEVCSTTGIYCSCGPSGATSCEDQHGNQIDPPDGACQGSCSAGEVQQADGSCSNPGPVDCSQNPDDPACDETTACDPAVDPNSAACKDYCAENPNDPTCQTGANDFCTQDPTDPKCSAFCAMNPTDPTCGGGAGSGGGGGGAGGANGGGACDYVQTLLSPFGTVRCFY